MSISDTDVIFEIEKEVNQHLPEAPSTLASLIAGAAGGVAQTVSGQPLDTIKTRAQTSPPGAFKGPMDIFMQTLKKEGFFALYKGMASPLIGVAGVNSLLFGANQLMRQLISPYGELSIPQIMLAGSLAGAIQAIMASPIEMFKIRMQAQYATNPPKLRQVVAETYAQYGWRKGIMRGYWVTAAKELPAYSGFYGGYELTKRYFQNSLGTQDLPVWATLTSGAMGGIGYWTACYPLDVVKSRVQLSKEPPKGANYIFNTFKTIYQQEGAKAFVRGLAPTYLRAIPSAATTFLAYEITVDFLTKHTSI